MSKNSRNSSGLRGLIRKSHFENGGSLSDWRGTHRIQEDESKKLDKYSCREYHLSDEDYEDVDDYFDSSYSEE